MGFLIYLILMPIIYCISTSPVHYEGCYDRHYDDKNYDRNTMISFVFWTILKLVSYYVVEIIYCLIIKSYINELPWKNHGFECIRVFNMLFVICSIVFIIMHVIMVYFLDFCDEGEIPPFAHIFVLGFLFLLFCLCFLFSGDINKELFEKKPYEISVEKLELHSLGDALIINEKNTSNPSYFDIEIKEGYTISYSYVVDGKLLIDNFIYSEDMVTIEEGTDNKTYLEITKYFKTLKVGDENMYDEYFTYHIYLPVGTLSKEN